MQKIINDINTLHNLLYENNPSVEDIKEIYEELINYIVEFYNLPNIKINFGNVTNLEALGSYNMYTNSININPNILDPTKIHSKQALDYLFVELIHTAFHEPRHYLQFEFLRNKIELPSSDSLSQLSEIEKKKVLEELKNASTDNVLYLNDGKLDNFPFFYYSRVHELDAVSTSMEYIKQIIDKLEPDVAQDLKSGLFLSNKYWDKTYNYTTPIIAKQRNFKIYETKKTIFGLKNIPINNTDTLIETAIREYLPISKALTEYNLLNFEGLTSEKISLGNYDIDVSVNNNTWFLHILTPYKDELLEHYVCIKNDNCCLFRADVTCEMKEDLKTLEDIFNISKAFSKVYSNMTGSKINTYTITPILGIYKESQRQKLLSNISKIAKLSYKEEPNKVFIRSSFSSTDKTSYPLNAIKKIQDFMLLKQETLDEKIDKYEKMQAALVLPKKIDEIIL